MTVFYTLSSIVSPRCGDAVYILLENGHPVGTAFSVSCSSKKLLLTAAHCVRSDSATYSIAKSVAKIPNDTKYEYTGVVSITNICRHDNSDIAILQVIVELPKGIPLCPKTELPTCLGEEKVKCYNVEVGAFINNSDEIHLGVSAYDFTKLRSVSNHHFSIVNQGQGHGSSGGPVVDKSGRLAGMIVSGKNDVISTSISNAVVDVISPPSHHMETEEFQDSAAFKELSEQFTEICIHAAKVSCLIPILCVQDLEQFLNAN